MFIVSYYGNRVLYYFSLFSLIMMSCPLQFWLYFQCLEYPWSMRSPSNHLISRLKSSLGLSKLWCSSPKDLGGFMPNVLRLIYILLIVEGPEPDQGSRCGVMSQVWCTGGARYTRVMQRVLCPAGCWLSLLSACTVNLCLVHCPSGPPSPFHGGCSAGTAMLGASPVSRVE